MILKAFVARLGTELPGSNWHLASEESTVVFPAVSQEFGNIEVTEEDGELTVYFGRFTHAHFACYDAGLSDAERANLISSNVISCLADTFADRLEFYGGRGAGGFRKRGTQSLLSKLINGQGGTHVWSGLDG